MYRLPRYQVIEEELRRFRAGLALEETNLPREIVRILHYIHENLFDTNLTVGLLKDRCSIRNNNMTMRFRFLMGIGLREYIEEQRLLAAAKVLEHEDIEVYMVAMHVGYAHAESFNRAFRRYFGCSPSDHRQNSAKQRLDEVVRPFQIVAVHA